MSKNGAPRFAWNFLGRETYKHHPHCSSAGRESDTPLRVCLRRRQAWRRGNGSIFVNGEKVATGRIEHTQPFAFGAETTDVGENLYTCVSDDYKVGDNSFTGKIHKVTVQVLKSNLSEEAQKAIAELRVKKAMAG